MHELLDEITACVLRHADGPRQQTRIPNVAIGVLHPGGAQEVAGCGSGVCLVLQGAKRMTVGSRTLHYGAGSCFTSLLGLPTTRIISETDGMKPYVATSLTFDPATFADLLDEMPAQTEPPATPVYHTAPISTQLLDAWGRLLALLDHPEDMPVLRTGRERELLYRLLRSEHGPMLREIARGDGRLAKIYRAIDWMRRNYEHPLPAETLARDAGMSLPTFNRHFRAATGTSPLQYHKTLRLQAARRLLAESADVTRAAFQVGYASPSQFSREYSRHFGSSPKRDAADMRNSDWNVSDILEPRAINWQHTLLS